MLTVISIFIGLLFGGVTIVLINTNVKKFTSEKWTALVTGIVFFAAYLFCIAYGYHPNPAYMGFVIMLTAYFVLLVYGRINEYK